VASALGALTDRLGASELMIAATAYDPADRIGNLELIAAAMVQPVPTN
jgi:hypothetical protein